MTLESRVAVAQVEVNSPGGLASEILQLRLHVDDTTPRSAVDAAAEGIGPGLQALFEDGVGTEAGNALVDLHVVVVECELQLRQGRWSPGHAEGCDRCLFRTQLTVAARQLGRFLAVLAEAAIGRYTLGHAALDRERCQRRKIGAGVCNDRISLAEATEQLAHVRRAEGL